MYMYLYLILLSYNSDAHSFTVKLSIDNNYWVASLSRRHVTVAERRAKVANVIRDFQRSDNQAVTR